MKRRADLVVPLGAGAIVADEVRRYGVLDVETGGFFAGSEADPTRITTVALAGEKGIERRWGLFRVSGKAMDRLFALADGQGLRLPAQFHSHGGRAFLSKTDRQHGFNVTDFISSVIPDYVDPPSDAGAWGWWVFDGSKWASLLPPPTPDGDVKVVVFDEDGVRPRG